MFLELGVGKKHFQIKQCPGIGMKAVMPDKLNPLWKIPKKDLECLNASNTFVYISGTTKFV